MRKLSEVEGSRIVLHGFHNVAKSAPVCGANIPGVPFIYFPLTNTRHLSEHRRRRRVMERPRKGKLQTETKTNLPGTGHENEPFL